MQPIFPNGGSVFPGGGGSSGPGLNECQQFVSPDGSDNNDGTTWQTAKETLWAGVAAVAEAGGGNVYVADGFRIGSPVAGGGLNIRGDDWVIPGWIGQPAGAIHIIGCGKSNGGVFMPGTVANMVGEDGSGGRTKPYFWAANIVNNPFTVTCIGLPGDGVGYTNEQPIKIGVDFDRYPNGDLLEIDVTNATRVGNETVLTVDVDGMDGYATATASRTDDVTALVIPNPGVAWIPFLGGTPFRLVSSNPDFPSGDYVTNEVSRVGTGNVSPVSWTIYYDDVGDDEASAAVTGTVKTHGCHLREQLELFSTNENFAATMYEVTDATVDTITVIDSDCLEVGDADEDDIGTMCHLEFDRAGTTTVTFNFTGVPLTQTPTAGPGILIGRNYAINPTFNNCYTQGLIGNPVIPSANRDDNRMAPMLAYAGNTFSTNFNTATGFNIYKHTGTNGPIIGVGRNGLGEFEFHGGTMETAVEAEAQALNLPGMRIHGGTFCKVYCDNLQVPDTFGPLAYSVELYNVPRSSAIITRTGPKPILGPCIGGDSWWSPGAWGAGTGNLTPWESEHTTAWADGRLAGKHPGTVRAAGPVSARFKNLIAEPGDWSLRGATRTLNTTDLRAPDGSQTATKIVSAGDFLSVLPTIAHPETVEAGGRFLFGVWVNATTALQMASSQFVWFNTTEIDFEPSNGGTNGSLKCPYQGPGWQWITLSLTVAAVDVADPEYEIEMLFSAGATVYLWGVTSYYIPPLYTGADAFEHMGCAPAQPRYLPQGMAGTFEEQKFIAHGGLGIDTGITKIVGGGSGQLTLTGAAAPYTPVYDADGTTILGWVPLLQATVNP
jgi:hypothetical protein